MIVLDEVFGMVSLCLLEEFVTVLFQGGKEDVAQNRHVHLCELLVTWLRASYQFLPLLHRRGAMENMLASKLRPQT
jgi:hypothetical protein